MIFDIFPSREIAIAALSILGLIVFFTVTFAILGRIFPKKDLSSLKTKTNSWWVIYFVFFGALLSGNGVFAAVFAFFSFTAFRELISVFKFRSDDRSSILLAYAAIPIQYTIVYFGLNPLAYIFIPCVMFIALSLNLAHSENPKGIITSYSLLLWALMITTYTLSFVPMILTIPGKMDTSIPRQGLVIFLVFLCQFNDVLQFLWGKALGKNKISINLSPGKTWEGFVGGLISTMLLSLLFLPLTNLSVTQGITAGLFIAVLGLAGDLFISSIKRDVGIKDLSNLIPGHGGICDRIDSLVFSPMIFFLFVNNLFIS
jgi:phosphatidate cytidylyltransferase